MINSTDWDEYLRKKAEQFEAGVISQKQYDDAVKDAKVQIEGFSANMRASTQQLGKSFLDLGGSLVKGASGASAYNNSINALSNVFAGLLSAIPYVGKLLGSAVQAGAKYATAVNEQSDALFETYQGLTRSGLATGMQDVFDNLHGMGYTMKEIGNMSALMQENSVLLANFGGTAAKGAKAFVSAAEGIQDSDISNKLKLMGMSVSDINKGIAGYMQIQRAAGALQNQTSEQLTNSAAAYIEQQDRLAKLTGIAAEQQNQIIVNALAEQRYAATQTELKNNGDEKSAQLAKRNDELLITFTSQFGTKTSRAFQDYASGMMNSEDAKKFERSFPKASELIRNGTATATEISQVASQDAINVRDSYNKLAKTGEANKIVTDYAEIVKGSGVHLKETAEESDEKAKKEQANQKNGTDAAAKSMVSLTNAQRNQTQAFEKLVNNGIEPVTAGLSAITDKITDVTGVVSTIAGKPEQVGGKPAAAAAAPATPTAQAPSKLTPEVKEKAEKLIKFQGGNTGNKSNFDAISTKVRDAFMMMVAEFGQPVQINSAKRDPADQKRLYDAWIAAGGGPNKPTVNVPGTGRITTPAKPGDHNPHVDGRAIDMDLGSYSALSGLFGKYGFQTVNRDPGHIQMPSAATGGIVSGPKQGYNAMLHGTEAVVPMNESDKIQVNLPNQNAGENIAEFPVENRDDEEELRLLTMKIGTLDNLIRSAQKNVSTYEKILKKQH